METSPEWLLLANVACMYALGFDSSHHCERQPATTEYAQSERRLSTLTILHADHWQGNKRYPFAQGIYPANTQTLGDGILHQFSESTHYWWCWVAVGVLIGYILLLNVLIAVLLTVLPRKSFCHCCLKQLLFAYTVA